MANEHDRRIDYLEFTVADVAAARRFYEFAFGWTFQDYGPDYTSFNDGRLSGGFSKGAHRGPGGPLVVLYATGLKDARERIVRAGGAIVREVFEFPGGCRFHFTDPCGNELAVWSEMNQ